MTTLAYDMTSFRVQTEVSASPIFFGWVFGFNGKVQKMCIRDRLYVKQIYEAEPLWVFYLLKNLNYDGFVGGSAVPTLNRNDVHALSLIHICFLESSCTGRKRAADRKGHSNDCVEC